MCTVSFLPSADGYHLAMNRDEQLSRMAALPPEQMRCGTLKAIYPHELGGGTWVGVNETGLAFALINWYSQPQRPRAGMITRGDVIPALLRAVTIAEARALLAQLPLDRMNPFRLIMVSDRENAVVESRWSGESLEEIMLPWQRQHWFSSGFDESEANRRRRLTCAREARSSSPDSVKWLRNLHRSHHPSKGAFSICMHRVDACTVSYTELSVNKLAAVMTYSAGPACERGPHFSKTLRISAQEFSRAA
jgi:hypothetical protein